MEKFRVRMLFFERGELLQEAEQNGIGPFEVMLFRHLAQFKKPPAAPVLSGEIDGPPALFKQFRRCLKDAEDIFFVLRIDLIVNSFRRNYQQVAGFAFKNTMHSLHPAGAPEKINEFTFENLKPIFNSKLDKMERVSLYLRPKNFFIGQEEYWVGKDNNFQNELKEFLVSKIYPQLAELCIESEGILALKKNIRYEKGCLYVKLEKLINSKALRRLRIIAFHSVVPNDVFSDGKRKVRLTTSRLKQYVNGVKSSLNDKVVSEIADKILSDIENKCSEIINDKPNVKYQMYRDYFESKSE